jgi:hypothetical protein
MSAQPFLGTPADVKAPQSRSISVGGKATVALALCILSVGAISYPQRQIQHVHEAAVGELWQSRNTLKDFSNRNTSQDTSKDVSHSTAEESKSAPKSDSAPKSESAPKSDRSDPTEIPPDVLKAAIRDITGLEGAARCIAAFLFDREVSSTCEAANPTLVAALTVVLSLYVLFFFAPFYMFPEAAVALGVWKLFPTLEKTIMVSAKDTNVLDTMRLGLLITFLVGAISRLCTLWKERNEQHAVGRQSSMLISIVVGFVLYFILSFLSTRS